MTLAANRRINAVLGALLLSLFPISARADETPFTQRDMYGEAGLLDMPSARMAPDGQLSLTSSFTKYAHRITLGFQILPWLEGAFRYTATPRLQLGATLYDRSFGLKARLFQEDTYTPELSIGIRDLVGTGVYGSEYLVATKQVWDFDVSAGLGWGRLSGNGTLENIFSHVFSSFAVRGNPTGFGGKVDFGQFFHGPDMGVFGGITWQTPIHNLNLTLEYSSDDYQRERAAGTVKMRTPINVGVNYSPINGISLGGGWFYGSVFGATLGVSIDPTTFVAPQKIGAPPMAVSSRSGDEVANALTAMVDNLPNSFGHDVQSSDTKPQHTISGVLMHTMGPPQNLEVNGRLLLIDVHASGRAGDYCRIYGSIAATSHHGIDTVVVTDLDDTRSKVAICDVPGDGASGEIVQASAQNSEAETADDTPNRDNDIQKRIRDDAAAQALHIEAISIKPHEITIYYTNHHYEFETSALGRLVRILMSDAPPDVEIFRLAPVYFGQPVQDIQIFRAPLERMFTAHGSTAEMHSAIGIRPAPLDNPVLEAAQENTYPRFSWAISPSLQEGLFDPTAPVRIQFYATLDGAVEVLPGLSVEAEYQANIYNSFGSALPSNSQLPHVRSDFASYLTKGRYSFSDLDVAYRMRVTPDIFVEAKAGYLEDMFAGAGGQILWRPENGRWALGADIYDVWQRNFDRLFGVQDYHVLTGHVSLYYQSPWHGVNVNLRAGRYLAGDNGFTVEVTRRFATGIEVGAFATFTNVPFSQFGEGSFDKGITLHIPLEWALPFSTQSSYNLLLRPLTRDGGQRLSGDDSLYEETRRTSYEEISESAENIAQP